MATQTFDLGAVYRDVEAIKGARLDNTHRKQQIDAAERQRATDDLLRQSAREAVNQETGQYDVAQHARILESRGYPDAAIALREATLKRFAEVRKYVTDALPMLNEQSYPGLIGKAVQDGILPAGIAPEKYDPAWVQNQIRNLDKETRRVYGEFKQIGTGPGGAVIYGQAEEGTNKLENVTTVKPYAPRSGSGGGGFQFRVGDSNAIYRQAVGLFGGTFDPMTGRIAGLNRQQSEQVQSIAALAARKYREAGGELDHASAVEEAFAEMRGGGGRPAAPGAAPRGNRPPLANFNRPTP